MPRTWDTEPLRALVERRERAIEAAMRPGRRSPEVVPQEAMPEEAAIEDERARHVRPSPPAASLPQPGSRQELRQLLSSRQLLRQAIIAGEVLGPPKALRP